MADRPVTLRAALRRSPTGRAHLAANRMVTVQRVTRPGALSRLWPDLFTNTVTTWELRAGSSEFTCARERDALLLALAWDARAEGAQWLPDERPAEARLLLAIFGIDPDSAEGWARWPALLERQRQMDADEAREAQWERWESEAIPPMPGE